MNMFTIFTTVQWYRRHKIEKQKLINRIFSYLKVYEFNG